MIRMKIKDICDLQNGRAFKPSDWGTAGLPIIRIQNLNDERAPFNYYGGKYNLAQEVDNGDLLFSWSGTPGTSFGAFLWNRGKGVLNQHIFKVIPKVEVDKTYLMYALNGNISTIISKAHGGVGLQHITKKELDEIEIQMVSISRQKKIVEILEKISLLIVLRKQQLEKLDELVKARFVEMFGDPIRNEKGWNTYTLAEMCDEIGDGLHGTPEYDENGEYPFINGNNLISGIIQINPSTKKVNKKTYEKHYIKISQNAILLSINGTLGRIAFYNSEQVMLGKSACYCNLRDEVNRIFVYNIMKTDAFARYLEDNATKSTIKNVGLKAIREYRLIMPPIPLQNQFSSFVERVDQQKQTVQQSLEKLELMKKALMQEYFG